MASQSKIEETQKDIKSISNELDNLKNQIISEYKDYLPNALRKYVKREISTQHNHLKEMGPASKGLKENIETAIEKIPSYLDKEITKDEIWPHKKNIQDGSRKVDFYERLLYRYDSFKEIREVMRKSIGTIGKLLIDAGFKIRDIEKDRNIVWRSSFILVESDDVLKLFKVYNETLKTFYEINKKLLFIEQDYEQKQAGDLWDNL